MKTTILSLCAMLTLICATSRADAQTQSAQRTRYVIGLSPFLDKAVKDDVYRSVIAFLLEDIPLNSSLWIYDAYYLRTITQIDIPDVRAFRSGKTRANQFKDHIRRLKDFLAADHEKPSIAKLPLNQAVRLPQFMDFLAENLAPPGHSVVAVILGSPLYVDQKEPGFSMVDGYFPSDGHLSATREDSVFGLKTRAGTLKNTTVHIGWFGDPWVSELHQEKISRFWNLYLQGQGARLGTFCGDLATVFNAARSGLTVSDAGEERFQIDPAQTKIEMLRITRDIGVADWITRDVLPIQREPPSITTGRMKIGIRWQSNIDLDLYAKPRRDGDTLFFENMRIPEGYYFKDHRSSPEREYEFIEFEMPVDVWQVEANINFYEGSADGGPSGEIRIEFDGKIYSQRFSIAAEHGNKGRSGRNQGEFWTRIDVPGILRLRQDSAASNR